jgi:DNA polymerase-3 subunit epsilon
MPDLDSAAFAVLDTETTGLDPAHDRVVSVAVVPVVHGRVVHADARHVLVDPGAAIPAEATLVHGLTDGDVAGAPDLATAMQGLAAVLQDRVVVGHNLEFDLGFLGHAMADPPAHTLDTLALSRLLWRRRGTRHTLDEAAGRVGVMPQDRHSALGDAMATAEVLVAVLPSVLARGWRTTDDVAAAAAAQRRSRARVRRSRARQRLGRARRTSTPGARRGSG